MEYLWDLEKIMGGAKLLIYSSTVMENNRKMFALFVGS